MAIPHDALDIAASMAIDVYSNPKDWIVHRGLTATWIAIEGSDELADWRRNFEFLLTSSDEHLGFGSYARELMAQMWAQGLQVDHSIPTILCGHSLGGAVATIIAAQLQDHVPLPELVTVRRQVRLRRGAVDDQCPGLRAAPAAVGRKFPDG